MTPKSRLAPPFLHSKILNQKRFRPPAEAESLLFAWPKRSNQEKGHPASAPRRSMTGEVRRWATGFVDRASCPDAKLAGIRAGHPSGFFFAHLPLQRGGKIKSRAQRARRLGDR